MLNDVQFADLLGIFNNSLHTKKEKELMTVLNGMLLECYLLRAFATAQTIKNCKIASKTSWKQKKDQLNLCE